MFRKFQSLKKLSVPTFFANSKSPSCSFSFLSHRYPLFKNYSFSTSKYKTNFQKDLHLLINFSPEHKAQMSNALDKYAAQKGALNHLTSDDVKSMLSALHHISLAHIKAGNHKKASGYLSDTDYILRNLDIKDTIDVALYYYAKSSILFSQEKFEEAEMYLNEVGRICKLLGDDPKAKSLTVQRWHLLAQAENPDKALKLYNAILENMGDVNESALPGLLTRVHQEMGEIYRLRDDFDDMIQSWENGFQAAIQYLGENSTLAFNFLCDIVNNLAMQDQNERAEPYAENRVRIALKAFPTPHENIAISYSLLGNIYLANEKYTQAMNSYNEAFKIFEKLPKDYSYILYDVYFSMAAGQGLLGRHQEASNFLSKAGRALIKANSNQSNSSVALVYSRWADDLKEIEMFTASQEYYLKALDLYKTLDLSNGAMIFSIYSSLGEVAETEEDWDKALEYWKEAEKYLDLTDALSVQKFYINLDSIYSNLEDREGSEKCVQKILESCETSGDMSYAFAVYYESGEDYEKEGQLEEALPCYEVAARVYEKDAKKDPVKAQNLDAKISQIKEKLQNAK